MQAAIAFPASPNELDQVESNGLDIVGELIELADKFGAGRSADTPTDGAESNPSSLLPRDFKIVPGLIDRLFSYIDLIHIEKIQTKVEHEVQIAYLQKKLRCDVRIVTEWMKSYEAILAENGELKKRIKDLQNLQANSLE